MANKVHRTKQKCHTMTVLKYSSVKYRPVVQGTGRSYTSRFPRKSRERLSPDAASRVYLQLGLSVCAHYFKHRPGNCISVCITGIMITSLSSYFLKCLGNS